LIRSCKAKDGSMHFDLKDAKVESKLQSLREVYFLYHH
jgi:hypothetical protein